MPNQRNGKGHKMMQASRVQLPPLKHFSNQNMRIHNEWFAWLLHMDIVMGLATCDDERLFWRMAIINATTNWNRLRHVSLSSNPITDTELEFAISKKINLIRALKRLLRIMMVIKEGLDINRGPCHFSMLKGPQKGIRLLGLIGYYVRAE